MFMVGWNLVRYLFALRMKDLAPAGVTLLVSLISNMAFGFVAGVVVYFGVKYYFRLTGGCASRSPLFDLTPKSRL